MGSLLSELYDGSLLSELSTATRVRVRVRVIRWGGGGGEQERALYRVVDGHGLWVLRRLDDRIDRAKGAVLRVDVHLERGRFEGDASEMNITNQLTHYEINMGSEVEITGLRWGV